MSFYSSRSQREFLFPPSRPDIERGGEKMVAADPLYEKLIKQLLLPELVLNILSPCFESFGCPLKRQITEDHLDVTIKYYGSQMNGHTIILCYIDKGTIEEPSGITSIVNLGYALRTK